MVKAVEWKPIETMPFGVVCWVKNDVMEAPVKAKRGYFHLGAVHPDLTFCTTEYTPHEFFPTFAGKLVCPTHWREFEEEASAAAKPEQMTLLEESAS